MRISIFMQTMWVFMISHWFTLIQCAPQDKLPEFRTSYSVSEQLNERRTENQLQGTIGVTYPHTENGIEESSLKDQSIFGMSTPSYETQESQLQSPRVASRKSTKKLQRRQKSSI